MNYSQHVGAAAAVAKNNDDDGDSNNDYYDDGGVDDTLVEVGRHEHPAAVLPHLLTTSASSGSSSSTAADAVGAAFGQQQQQPRNNGRRNDSGSSSGTSASSKSRREVSIFWDLTGCPIPSYVTAVDAARAVVQAVSSHVDGTIVKCRTYCLDQSLESGGHDSDWYGSGFDLVDDNHNDEDQKEKLLVDLLSFAWDRASVSSGRQQQQQQQQQQQVERHVVGSNNSSKPCVVVLTKNGMGYAYTLSKLRERGVLALIIYNDDDSKCAGTLQAAADLSLRFHQDVMNDPAVAQGRPVTAHPGGTSTTTTSGGRGGGGGGVNDQQPSKQQQQQDKPTEGGGCGAATTQEVKDTWTHSTYAQQEEAWIAVARTATTTANKEPEEQWTTVTSSKSMIPGQVQTLCKMLADTTAKAGGGGGGGVATTTANATDTEGWVLGSKLGVAFRAAAASSTATADIKEQYQTARETAIQKDLVERGRRYLGTGPKKNEVVPEKNNEKWKMQGKLSKEDFFRLTKEGRQVVQEMATSALTKSDPKKTNLFVKNIPREMGIFALVEYLEREFQVDVSRGYFLPGPSNVAYAFACLQVMTSQDADRLVDASGKALLVVQGRVLSVKPNTDTYNTAAIDPKSEYKRPPGKPKQRLGVQPSSETPLSQEANSAVAYCRAVDAFLRQRVSSNSPNLPEGWCDAGFWVQLKVDLLGGDKDRVKEARSVAIAKGWIEVGRRIFGTEGANIQIEAVKGTRNPSRHALELYVRVTEQGEKHFGTTSTSTASVVGTSTVTLSDSRTESGSKLEDRLVFVKNLPPNALVHEFVQFLELDHGLAVDKAWVEEPKPTSSFTNAHLEMIATKDALRIIHLASRAGEGVFFQRRPLEVVRDQRIPNFRRGDPRFYFREGTMTNTSQRPFATRSKDSSADNNRDIDITASLCRVLWEKGSAKGNGETWINSGAIGEAFMRRLRNASPEERKLYFSKARQSAIEQGLVDFGRRILASPIQEVCVAAFVGNYDSSKLSSEQYLRLTGKGATLVNASTSAAGGSTPGIVEDSIVKNGYFINLSSTTKMKDFVEHLKTTHGVLIRYGILRRTPGFVTAQVEFMTGEDYIIVYESLSRQNGMVFDGSTVRMREDKGIPDWIHARSDDPDLFYSQPKEEGTAKAEVTKTAFNAFGREGDEATSIRMTFPAKPSPIPGDSLFSSDSAHRIMSALSFDMADGAGASDVDISSLGGGTSDTHDIFRTSGIDLPPGLFGAGLGTGSAGGFGVQNAASAPASTTEAELFQMVWDHEARTFRRMPMSRDALESEINRKNSGGIVGGYDQSFNNVPPVPVHFRRVPDYEGEVNMAGTGFLDSGVNFSQLPMPNQPSYPFQPSYPIQQPMSYPNQQPMQVQPTIPTHSYRLPGSTDPNASGIPVGGIYDNADLSSSYVPPHRRSSNSDSFSDSSRNKKWSNVRR